MGGSGGLCKGRLCYGCRDQCWFHEQIPYKLIDLLFTSNTNHVALELRSNRRLMLYYDMSEPNHVMPNRCHTGDFLVDSQSILRRLFCSSSFLHYPAPTSCRLLQMHYGLHGHFRQEHRHRSSISILLFLTTARSSAPFEISMPNLVSATSGLCYLMCQVSC